MRDSSHVIEVSKRKLVISYQKILYVMDKKTTTRKPKQKHFIIYCHNFYLYQKCLCVVHLLEKTPFKNVILRLIS